MFLGDNERPTSGQLGRQQFGNPRICRLQKSPINATLIETIQKVPRSTILPTEATIYCFWLQVNPEKPDRYLAAHEQVWPETPRVLERIGWKNYSCVAVTLGPLVGYLEPEPGVDPIAGIASLAVNERWQRETAKFFEGSDTTKTEGFTLLTETPNLDSQLDDLAAENKEG